MVTQKEITFIRQALVFFIARCEDRKRIHEKTRKQMESVKLQIGAKVLTPGLAGCVCVGGGGGGGS